MSAPAEPNLRVLVWNLERKKPTAPRGREAFAHLFAQEPDVMVLTETRTSMPSDGGYTVWPEPPRGQRFAEDERKIGLWSRQPWIDIGEFNHPELDQTRFVSGTTDSPIGSVRVVGVCIPYQMAEVTHPVGEKRRPWELHMEYLHALGELLEHNDLPMIAAGDFNQPVPRTHGPHRVAEALDSAFETTEIVTTGRPDGCDRPGIDHIAVSPHLEASTVWGWRNDVAGARLSDHDGAGATVRRRRARRPRSRLGR